MNTGQNTLTTGKAQYSVSNGNVIAGKEVLIVEDDPATSETLFFLMGLYGYLPTVVPTRDEALAQLLPGRFKIILMDYFMPGLTAPKFLSDVNRLCPNPAIILMSASVDVKQTARELGLQYYIRKPFEMSDLLFRLESIAGTGPLVTLP